MRGDGEELETPQRPRDFVPGRQSGMNCKIKMAVLQLKYDFIIMILQLNRMLIVP